MNDQARPIEQPAPSVLAAKPTTLAECHAVIEAQALQIGQLCEQMAAIQERLKLDSRNSSKPPSSDGPDRPNRAQRRASERKRGAQKGHPGSYRALLDESALNGVHDCLPQPQCECGAAVVAQGKPVPHQVFDIAPVKADVQQYRLYSGVCAGCGKLHRAALPAGVPSGQIGPRALALIGVLATRYHLTQFKIRDLLAQHHQVSINGAPSLCGVSSMTDEHNVMLAALKVKKPKQSEQLSLL